MAARHNITVDVTDWSPSARRELMDTISMIESSAVPDPLTRAELVAALDAEGYDGPTEYDKASLVALLDIVRNATKVSTPLIPLEVDCWTEDLFNKALKRLIGMGSEDQWRICRLAYTDGDTPGFISRQRVYEACSYPASRSLKGFTRPTNTVTELMKAHNGLPQGASALLRPVYDGKAVGYSRVVGFAIPDELVWENVTS